MLRVRAIILVPRRAIDNWPAAALGFGLGFAAGAAWVIIRHSLKNVFNNKLIMLLCLNDINKKRNFRVRNHHNKHLVRRQGGGQNNITSKIISRTKIISRA